MNKRNIIILIAAMVFLGVRLYQKYKKKANSNLPSDTSKTSTNGFPSSSKEDDYEPYSKK